MKEERTFSLGPRRLISSAFKCGTPKFPEPPPRVSPSLTVNWELACMSPYSSQSYPPLLSVSAATTTSQLSSCWRCSEEEPVLGMENSKLLVGDHVWWGSEGSWVREGGRCKDCPFFCLLDLKGQVAFKTQEVKERWQPSHALPHQETQSPTWVSWWGHIGATHPFFHLLGLKELPTKERVGSCCWPSLHLHQEGADVTALNAPTHEKSWIRDWAWGCDPSKGSSTCSFPSLVYFVALSFILFYSF